MRPFILICISTVLLFACNSGDKTPDVSGIKVSMTTERFEKKIFDTTAPSLTSYLQQLQSSDPQFTNLFITEILGADPRWSTDTIAEYVNGFVKSYRGVFKDAETIFSDFSKYENEIKKSVQLTKHYFPQYKVPEKIITYIGPADGYGDIISKDAFLVGLQYHLGSSNPLYKTSLVQQTYPDYISRRFEPAYITVNCVRNIVDDIYPEQEKDKPLVNQMVEKGKRLYIMSKLLPGTEDYKIIGYTEKQMKDCIKNEAQVWDLFVKNSLLQSIDKNMMKDYLGESPTTQALGEGSPGNIGSFAGWQIVKKYMEKKPETTPEQLIKLDEETIFQEAKYKP